MVSVFYSVTSSITSAAISSTTSPSSEISASISSETNPSIPPFPSTTAFAITCENSFIDLIASSFAGIL